MADGTVPAAQVTRLQAMGAWLGVNGEAIFGTPSLDARRRRDHATARRCASPGAATAADSTPSCWARCPPARSRFVGLSGLTGPAQLLGTSGDLAVTASGGDLHVALPASPPAQAAHVFALPLGS